MENEITTNKIRFMFGGNCTFTIQTGSTHYSYKIYRKRTDDGAKIWQLYLKKSGKGIYCGFFKVVGNKLTFKNNTKYNIPENDPAIITLLNTIKNRNTTDNVICHAGRCAHCGRLLTDPVSIQRGFGPDCWKVIQGK